MALLKRILEDGPVGAVVLEAWIFAGSATVVGVAVGGV